MILLWTDNLSVGVKYFDEDHRRLISMINELNSAVQNVDVAGSIAEDEIEIALHRLENYFEYHCLQEEVFMENIGFPELDDHRLHHRQFLEKIKSMSDAMSGSRDPLHAKDLMQFIYDWLINHVNGADKKYGEYLHSEKASRPILNNAKPGVAGRNLVLTRVAPASMNGESRP